MTPQELAAQALQEYQTVSYGPYAGAVALPSTTPSRNQWSAAADRIVAAVQAGESSAADLPDGMTLTNIYDYGRWIDDPIAVSTVSRAHIANVEAPVLAEVNAQLETPVATLAEAVGDENITAVVEQAAQQTDSGAFQAGASARGLVDGIVNIASGAVESLAGAGQAAVDVGRTALGAGQAVVEGGVDAAAVAAQRAADYLDGVGTPEQVAAAQQAAEFYSTDNARQGPGNQFVEGLTGTNPVDAGLAETRQEQAAQRDRLGSSIDELNAAVEDQLLRQQAGEFVNAAPAPVTPTETTVQVPNTQPLPQLGGQAAPTTPTAQAGFSTREQQDAIQAQFVADQVAADNVRADQAQQAAALLSQQAINSTFAGLAPNIEIGGGNLAQLRQPLAPQDFSTQATGAALDGLAGNLGGVAYSTGEQQRINNLIGNLGGATAEGANLVANASNPIDALRNETTDFFINQNVKQAEKSAAVAQQIPGLQAQLRVLQGALRGNVASGGTEASRQAIRDIIAQQQAQLAATQTAASGR